MTLLANYIKFLTTIFFVRLIIAIRDSITPKALINHFSIRAKIS